MLKMVFDLPSVWTEVAVVSVAAMLLQGVIGTWHGTYRHRWRFTSFDEVSAIGSTWLLVTLLIVGGNRIFRYGPSDLPSSAILMGSVLALGWMAGARVIWRRLWELQRRPLADRARRTIVFGAGEGGSQMVRAMLVDPDSDYIPVALLDDDPSLSKREISGISVEGTRHDLAAVAERHRAEVLLVAITSADAALIEQATKQAAQAGLEVRVLPATSELVSKMTIADVRPPTVDDLLGRDPVEIDVDSVSDYIRGRRVLISGAGGSIGSELSRQVARFDPAELYLLDRDESALHSLQLSMDGRALLEGDRLVVADIRDRDRMFEVFSECKPEVVFHTAALKHLTLLQNHPLEGVKSNVLGTQNMLDAAQQSNVDRFVNISTDKAADPTSVLGATKLAAERLTAQAAAKGRGTYLSVRFGNVLGSRGSVLPTFLKQIEEGLPLTVTDPQATRFFMTIPEAARLVIQAGAIGEPGEVLILDMGQPVNIAHLAQRLIDMLRPGTEIEYTGLRPGEKLHEVLVAAGEIGGTRFHPRIIHTPAQAIDPMEALGSLDPVSQEAAARLIGYPPSLTTPMEY